MPLAVTPEEHIDAEAALDVWLKRPCAPLDVINATIQLRSRKPDEVVARHATCDRIEVVALVRVALENKLVPLAVATLWRNR